jgi:hypothetical protein
MKLKFLILLGFIAGAVILGAHKPGKQTNEN